MWSIRLELGPKFYFKPYLVEASPWINKNVLELLSAAQYLYDQHIYLNLQSSNLVYFFITLLSWLKFNVTTMII